VSSFSQRIQKALLNYIALNMDFKLFWFLTDFCLIAYLFPRLPAGVEFYFKLPAAASLNIDYRRSVEHRFFRANHGGASPK